MGKVLPETTAGDLKGGANHIIISGSEPKNGNYIHYEWPAGGTGASGGTDGSNAVRSYNEGDFNSIQSVETDHPKADGSALQKKRRVPHDRPRQDQRSLFPLPGIQKGSPVLQRNIDRYV